MRFFRKKRRSEFLSDAKKRFRRRCILLAEFAIVILLLFLLLYRPAAYKRPAASDFQNTYVSQYLTNVLLPQIYNGVQREKPFEIIVTQDGINEIITSSQWPKQVESISFSALPPKVLAPQAPGQVRISLQLPQRCLAAPTPEVHLKPHPSQAPWALPLEF